jgi:mRNA-degrading endonuclease RelE of RelBE toxin-antitoxin system
MDIVKTSDFEKSLARLPTSVQRLCDKQLERFIADWKDPRLHIKKVRTLSLAMSFRVTRRYRVFFYFRDATTAIVFDIDHRKDIYRNIK